MDYFSHFIFLKATIYTNGVTVINTWLKSWSPIISQPQAIYSDNGSYFHNEITINIMEYYGTKMIFSPVLYLSLTGISEHIICMVKQQLGKWAAAYKGDKLEEWNLFIPTIPLNLNTRYIPSIGFKPDCAFLGFNLQKKVMQDAIIPRLPSPNKYKAEIIPHIIGL